MRLILIIISLFLFTSIAPAQKASNKKLYKTDLVSMYDESNFTKFSLEVYHNYDDTSTVYIAIKLDDLLYLPGLQTGSHLARFKIYYELFENYEAKVFLDTA